MKIKIMNDYGGWIFIIKSSNGRVVAISSKSYKKKENAWRVALSLKEGLLNASIEGYPKERPCKNLK